jgi:Zn-dependent protease
MSETAVPTTPPPFPAEPPKRTNNAVGVGLLAAWLALGGLIASHPSGLAVFGFVMLGWGLAVVAHEFSHAAVGWLAGDRTVAAKGYLSFDRRRYGDLGVSLVIPLLALAVGGIGFPGGAVYLRNDLMRSRLWRSAAALAGPAATFAVLVLLAAGLGAWRGRGVEGQGAVALFEALSVLAFLQAMALVLNLLPVPGLDGFNAIRPWLPGRWAGVIRRIEGLAMVAILLLIFYAPQAGRGLFAAAGALGGALGLDLAAVRGGWALFHFWRAGG